MTQVHIGSATLERSRDMPTVYEVSTRGVVAKQATLETSCCALCNSFRSRLLVGKGFQHKRVAKVSSRCCARKFSHQVAWTAVSGCGTATKGPAVAHRPSFFGPRSINHLRLKNKPNIWTFTRQRKKGSNMEALPSCHQLYSRLNNMTCC